MDDNLKTSVPVTEQEWIFIEYLRQMKEGIIYVDIEDGVPITLTELPIHKRNHTG